MLTLIIIENTEIVDAFESQVHYIIKVHLLIHFVGFEW